MKTDKHALLLENIDMAEEAVRIAKANTGFFEHRRRVMDAEETLAQAIGQLNEFVRKRVEEGAQPIGLPKNVPLYRSL